MMQDFCSAQVHDAQAPDADANAKAPHPIVPKITQKQIDVPTFEELLFNLWKMAQLLSYALRRSFTATAIRNSGHGPSAGEHSKSRIQLSRQQFVIFLAQRLKANYVTHS